MTRIVARWGLLILPLLVASVPARAASFYSLSLQEKVITSDVIAVVRVIQDITPPPGELVSPMGFEQELICRFDEIWHDPHSVATLGSETKVQTLSAYAAIGDTYVAFLGVCGSYSFATGHNGVVRVTKEGTVTVDERWTRPVDRRTPSLEFSDVTIGLPALKEHVLDRVPSDQETILDIYSMQIYPDRDAHSDGSDVVSRGITSERPFCSEYANKPTYWARAQISAGVLSQIQSSSSQRSDHKTTVRARWMDGVLHVLGSPIEDSTGALQATKPAEMSAPNAASDDESGKRRVKQRPD